MKADEALEVTSYPDVVVAILHAFERYGNDRYGSEAVSQLQHALQTATWAMESRSSESLIVSALLHDLGHILNNQELPREDSVDLDDGHEAIAHNFLLGHFGSEVVEPIRLHVAAKRYLCTKFPEYQNQLSPASYKSYMDQGGPMNESERKEFEASPYFDQAIQLRKWDDLAKDVNKQTPPLEFFVGHLIHGLTNNG